MILTLITFSLVAKNWVIFAGNACHICYTCSGENSAIKINHHHTTDVNTNVTNTNHKSTTTTPTTTTTAENDKEVVHNYQPNINASPNVNNSVATKTKVDTAAALSPSQLHTIPEDGSSNQEQKENIQPVQNKGRVFTLFYLSK